MGYFNGSKDIRVYAKEDNKVIGVYKNVCPAGFKILDNGFIYIGSGFGQGDYINPDIVGYIEVCDRKED